MVSCSSKTGEEEGRDLRVHPARWLQSFRQSTRLCPGKEAGLSWPQYWNEKYLGDTRATFSVKTQGKGALLKLRHQSRVVFISLHFTKYQEKAIGFKDLPMELWEAHKYDNGGIVYNQLTAPDASESIKTITKSKIALKIGTEIKVYTEDDHLKTGSDNAGIVRDPQNESPGVGG